MEKKDLKEKIQFGWNTKLEGQEKRDFIFMQLYRYLLDAKSFPEMGNDIQGSDIGFDWYLLTEMEARKIVEDILKK